MFAGAIAVELMAATLQHPLGIDAPAAVAGEHVNQEELPLGPVPHMVRGQLSGFSQMCLSGQAFRNCTACSQTVVDQYKQHGWSFLWQALQVRSASDTDNSACERFIMGMVAVDLAFISLCERALHSFC